MKLCRFQPRVFPADQVGSTTHPQILQGVIAGDDVSEVTGEILNRWSVTKRSWALTDVKLLPPVNPGKIVCVGKNYVEPSGEMNRGATKEPSIFLKPPSAILGPEEPIILPPSSQRVEHEGELAVVISRDCSYLSDAEDVRPYIAGYTCMNDVTARDFQNSDKHLTRAKGFDTFCPIGPILETEFDLASSYLETRVNGVRKQYSAFGAMIFPVDVIIRWVSRVMTLLPGDVIATGTPAGAGPLQSGDIVEVMITGIGTLRNPVVARPA